jgi:hypothetical protein
MPEGTGACGINCLVCGLFRQGKCGLCAAGDDPGAQKKLAVQLKLLGGVCPILECAAARSIDYCSANCEIYPCRHFMQGPYPLSESYLQMQIRRRGQPGAPSASDAGPRGRGPKLH